MPSATNSDERDYIREALSFAQDLPWEVLNRLGIKRNMETQFHPGQTIVMYPPFEALSPDYDENAFFERIPSIGDSPLSMYLHVPFCTGICTYCSYARSARRQSDVMAAYVEALMHQRDDWISRLDIKADVVDTIFIGGGTPTTLDEDTLLRLVDTTPRSRDCEFSVETDPDMATRADGPGKLVALRQAGVNRISMGVETFDDVLAKAIGRRGHDRVLEALSVIRQAGFNDINIDLIYGLPNQSLQSWLETLQAAVNTDVSSVTLYCYKLKPGSVDWKRSKSTSSELGYGQQAVVMQKMGEMYLCGKGYNVVNSKWFVKTKKTFRQQTRKYQNSTLLGLGASTYSFIGKCQLVTQSNTKKYITAVTNGMPVVERGRMLCDEELACRRFVFGFKSGVNRADTLAKVSPMERMRINALIDELADADLLTTEDDQIILSNIGRLFADEVCSLMYSPAVDAELERVEQVERPTASPMAGDLGGHAEQGTLSYMEGHLMSSEMTRPLQKIEELRAERARLELGGGQAGIERQHTKGKLTARERIARLVDDGTFQEIGLFAKHQCCNFGMRDKEMPGDGVVTGCGAVDGRIVHMASQDFTVAGGAAGEVHCVKMAEMQALSLKTGSPFIFFSDSGGARVQEGVDSLHGHGQIFHQNVQLSGTVPQISLVCGPCVGGAAYSAALTDFIIQTRQAQMFLAGPQLIKLVTGEETTAEALGSAETQMNAGLVDLIAADDNDAIEKCRRLLSFLPQNNLENPPRLAFYGAMESDPELNHLIPADTKRPYDVRTILSRIVDHCDFFELQPHYAPNLVTGFARIQGRPVGIVANQPCVMGGALDIHASDKAARFVRFCNAFNFPLLFFVDVPGFLPGLDQESGGIIRNGAKMLFASSAATVPKITVIMRKAIGGAYFAMGSKELGADRVIAWPTTEISVMGAEGAAETVFRREIERSTDPVARRGELIREYRDIFSNPNLSAARRMVDDIIEPSETRRYLSLALDSLHSKCEARTGEKHGRVGPTYELKVEMAKGNAVPRDLGYPPTYVETAATPPQQGPFTSRSPWGGIVTRIEVEPGQQVEQDDLLLVLETMKMETDITASFSGIVRAVNVAQGDDVKANQVLVEVEEDYQ